MLGRRGIHIFLENLSLLRSGEALSANPGCRPVLFHNRRSIRILWGLVLIVKILHVLNNYSRWLASDDTDTEVSSRISKDLLGLILLQSKSIECIAKSIINVRIDLANEPLS